MQEQRPAMMAAAKPAFSLSLSLANILLPRRACIIKVVDEFLSLSLSRIPKIITREKSSKYIEQQQQQHSLTFCKEDVELDERYRLANMYI